MVKEMPMKVYGVIMAGGGGTRFWPLSRQKRPKQLLNLSGNDLMINETIDRIHQLIDYDDIYIVTNDIQAEDMRKAVEGRLKPENILSEPAARNTSACIGYAAEVLEKKCGGGIMCVFPSDHYIKDESKFVKVLSLGIEEVKNRDCLLTIGITPSFAATGYGYIQYENDAYNSHKVVKFVEKPDTQTAEKYLNDGRFLWNSGMFVWRSATVLEEIKKYIPDVFTCISKIGKSLNTETEVEVIRKIYPTIPKVSIDYGVMEKSKRVRCMPGDFGWNDVGSWDMLEAIHEKDSQGNIFLGDHISIDSSNSVLYSSTGKITAMIGIDDLIVVETEDALLISSKKRAQDVKKIVEYLQKNNRDELL